MRDYYRDMDLATNATPDEIKGQYKRLAKEFHPDKGGNEEDFKKLNELYQDENLLGMYVKAEEIGLELEELSEEEYKEAFEVSCSSLKTKIDFYQTTAAWKWGTAKEEEREILATSIEIQAKVKRRK